MELVAALSQVGRTNKSLKRVAYSLRPSTIKKMSYAAKSNAFLTSRSWRELRYTVLKERGAKCECCGASAATGAAIHVDHIKPRFTHPELALVKTNLQVLCEDCNVGKVRGTKRTGEATNWIGAIRTSWQSRLLRKAETVPFSSRGRRTRAASIGPIRPLSMW